MTLLKLLKEMWNTLTFSWKMAEERAIKQKIRIDKWKVKHDPNFIAKIGKKKLVE